MEKIPSALLLLAGLASASGAVEVIYKQVGETVTLDPPTGFESHKFYLTWSFEGFELGWRNHMGGRELTKDEKWKGISWKDSALSVTNLQPGQFGTYLCKDNEGLLAKISYKVLRLTVSAEPPLVLPGQDATLVCDAARPSGGRAAVKWLNPRDEEILKGTHRVTATGRDHGRWTCVVTADGGTTRAQTSLTVVDLSSPPSEYTSDSSPLTVPCSVPAQVPWERIKAMGLRGGHWRFLSGSGSVAQTLFNLSLEDPASWKAVETRGLTPVSDFKNRNLALGRKLGRGSDRGDYVCTLVFEDGRTLTRTVHVDVLEITSSPGTDLISGQPLNLTCGLGVPLASDLRLRWIPPEKSSLRPPASGLLSVPAVARADEGRWRCELWRGDSRLTSAVVKLKIEPRLSAWTLVTVCGVALIVALLLVILAVVLCRRRRARQELRHTRRRLCQCKNPKPKGFYKT